MEKHVGIFCENLRKRDNLEYLKVDRRIILKLILKIKIRTAEGRL